jgi:hypothetical protein
MFISFLPKTVTKKHGARPRGACGHRSVQALILTLEQTVSGQKLSLYAQVPARASGFALSVWWVKPLTLNQP